ncbi:MAG: hypothetical protein LDL19_07020, partial [Thiobacillus sp.]|nr:hypothetical protein [Thiobacillus sp.]
YRLSMNRTADARRGKSPMPPPAILTARGLTPEGWARSPQLDALLADLRQRLQRQGRVPDTLLAQPFDRLRSCLP